MFVPEELSNGKLNDNNVYHEHKDQTDYICAQRLPPVNPDCFYVLLCSLTGRRV